MLLFRSFGAFGGSPFNESLSPFSSANMQADMDRAKAAAAHAQNTPLRVSVVVMFPNAQNCVCKEPRPSGDIIVCQYIHLYHPLLS